MDDVVHDDCIICFWRKKSQNQKKFYDPHSFFSPKNVTCASGVASPRVRDSRDDDDDDDDDAKKGEGNFKRE